MAACVRCQRSENERDWHKRADVNWYGLNVCFKHEIELRLDLDRIASIGSGDPEAAHGEIDEVLQKWSPRPLAQAIDAAIARHDWWATA